MTSLLTPYDLPFLAEHSPEPLLASGADVRLDVVLRDPVDAGLSEKLTGLVILFTELASTGALAGVEIPPWGSAIRDGFSGPTAIAPNHLSWVLQTCVVDETALLILAHALLDVHERHPILRFVASNSAQVTRIDRDASLRSPYPDVFKNVPFPWSVSREIMDEATLSVRFASEPDADQQKTIGNKLLTWAAATAMGAYAVAPLLPADCGMAVDPDIAFSGQELEWSFAKFLGHPDAFKGLVNALTSLARKTIAIEEVAIE